MPTDQAVTVARATEALSLRVEAGGEHLEAAITGAQVCDLLSHVMAQGKHGHLWITIQTHPNIIAVAALAGLSGIVIASGFEPEDDTVMRAEDEGIPLLMSPQTAYELAGKLYELGVR
ncbi:MAG: DRTGG domain-containing protein [Armatimonadia bacterium]